MVILPRHGKLVARRISQLAATNDIAITPQKAVGIGRFGGDEAGVKRELRRDLSEEVDLRTPRLDFREVGTCADQLPIGRIHHALLRLEVVHARIERIHVKHPAREQSRLQAQFPAGGNLWTDNHRRTTGRQIDLAALEPARNSGVGHGRAIEVVLSTQLPRNLVTLQLGFALGPSDRSAQ